MRDEYLDGCGSFKLEDSQGMVDIGQRLGIDAWVQIELGLDG